MSGINGKLEHELKRLSLAGIKCSISTGADGLKIGTLEDISNQIKRLIVPYGIETIYIGGTTELNAGKLLGNIEEIKLPASLKIIGNWAFYNTTRLERLELSEGIEEIRERAFMWSSIEHIKFPNTLRYIGRYAFANSNIEDIEIDNSEVDRLQSKLFFNCKRLRKVKIPDTLNWIDSSCFDGCNRLENINIPTSLEFIGSGAFTSCRSLREIDLSKTKIKSIWYGVFADTDGMKLILPKRVKGLANFSPEYLLKRDDEIFYQ